MKRIVGILAIATAVCLNLVSRCFPFGRMNSGKIPRTGRDAGKYCLGPNTPWLKILDSMAGLLRRLTILSGSAFKLASISMSTGISRASFLGAGPITRRSSSPLQVIPPRLVLLAGTYHFFDGPLTPYIEANVGGTYVNTDIAAGPPVVGSYYDPWYGNICGVSQPTKSGTFLSYGVGGGLRWDVNNLLFFRGGARQEWIDLSHTGTPSFTIIKLDLGFKF